MPNTHFCLYQSLARISHHERSKVKWKPKRALVTARAVDAAAVSALATAFEAAKIYAVGSRGASGHGVPRRSMKAPVRSHHDVERGGAPRPPPPRRQVQTVWPRMRACTRAKSVCSG